MSFSLSLSPFASRFCNPFPPIYSSSPLTYCLRLNFYPIPLTLSSALPCPFSYSFPSLYFLSLSFFFLFFSSFLIFFHINLFFSFFPNPNLQSPFAFQPASLSFSFFFFFSFLTVCVSDCHLCPTVGASADAPDAPSPTPLSHYFKRLLGMNQHALFDRECGFHCRDTAKTQQHVWSIAF